VDCSRLPATRTIDLVWTMLGATMTCSQAIAGCAGRAAVLAGIIACVACDARPAAKASASSGSAVSQARAAPSPRAPAEAPRKAECAACELEDQRLAAHREQVVVSARYLGLDQRWQRSIDGQRTKRRCTRDEEVMGVARFDLVGENPWRNEFAAPPTRKELARMMEVDLPCPELSRPQYAKLYQYDPDDSQRDGLGHAPVLRRGQLYRLTFVRSTFVAMREPSHPRDGRLVLTLVAVNPIRP